MQVYEGFIPALTADGSGHGIWNVIRKYKGQKKIESSKQASLDVTASQADSKELAEEEEIA